MSQSVITGSDSTPVYRVRKIGPADLKDALAKGLADFSAKPSHLVFGSHLSSRRDRACSRREVHCIAIVRPVQQSSV